MHRVIVFPGQVARETDILSTNRYAMEGMAAISGALFGLTPTITGFAAYPAPPGLFVAIGPGAMFAPMAVDASRYGSLEASGAVILKHAALTESLTLQTPAPAGAGQVAMHLIQARLAEVDEGASVIPYFNAVDPSMPIWGVGGNGLAQPTQRTIRVELGVKGSPGALPAAAVPPSPDPGWTPLYVVTVPAGAVSVPLRAISPHPAAPRANTGLMGTSPRFAAPARGVPPAAQADDDSIPTASWVRNVVESALSMPVYFAASGSDALGAAGTLHGYGSFDAPAGAAWFNEFGGFFTAPVSGIYGFSASVYASNSGDHVQDFQIVRTRPAVGVTQLAVARTHSGPSRGDFVGMSVAAVRCEPGDKVHIDRVTGDPGSSAEAKHFSGALIRRL